jgi:hypothetical protein
MRSAFTAFAASYFALVFLKNGYAIKLIQDASKGAQDVARGARTLTKIG